MTWIRRAKPPSHTCDVPNHSFGPNGSRGDLWRCDVCHDLWRIGLACDTCDRNGGFEHPGVHQVGNTWRPATVWQRLRFYSHGVGMSTVDEQSTTEERDRSDEMINESDFSVVARLLVDLASDTISTVYGDEHLPEDEWRDEARAATRSVVNQLALHGDWQAWQLSTLSDQIGDSLR